MIWAIRNCVLAAGAAALLSTQAAYAAPALSKPAIDPLVTLSVLGTAQSRAAVCAGGASAAAAAGAALASQTAPPGCVFPVVDQPVAPAAVPPPVVPAVAPPPPGKEIGWLPLLGGLALAAILAALLLSDDDEATPLSP